MLSALLTFLTIVVKMSVLLLVVWVWTETLLKVIGRDCFSKILAKSYPYSKAVHMPCPNSSGNLENNERPLMIEKVV